jgi:hypothetical protein
MAIDAATPLLALRPRALGQHRALRHGPVPRRPDPTPDKINEAVVAHAAEFRQRR